MPKVTLHREARRGVWQLRWFDADGRRRGETIGKLGQLTRRDALAIRRDKQSKMDCGLERPDKPKRMSLEEFLRRDREAVAIDVKPTTLRELKIAANHAITALGKDLDVRQIDHAHVGKLKKHLAELKLAAATICKVVRHLQGAFGRGVKLRLVVANPFEGVRLPKVQSKAVRVYGAHEVQDMLDVAASGWWRCRSCGATGAGVVAEPKGWKCSTVGTDGEKCPGKVANEDSSLWWGAFIRVAYTAGLRLGELLNLLWSDLDLKTGKVWVQRKQGGTAKVGDHVVPILAWTAKDYEARSMPIPPDTVATLLRLKAQSGGSPYVFLPLERLKQIGEHLAASGGRLDCNYALVPHLHTYFHRLHAAAAVLAAKRCPDAATWERRTIHDLRRSYGTVMAQHVPMHDLKALMGHSTIRTTEMYYLAAGDVSEKVRAAFGAITLAAG